MADENKATPSPENAPVPSSTRAPAASSLPAPGFAKPPGDDGQSLSPNAPAFYPNWKKSSNAPTSAPSRDTPHSLSGARSASFSCAQQQSQPKSLMGNGALLATPTRSTILPLPTTSSPHTPFRPGMPTRAASWREDASPSWREQHSFGNTQQQPGTPNGDDSKASKAITVEHRMIKPGCYSTWVRVLSADIGPAQLATVLSRCEESNSKGAIHVYLREKFIQRPVVQQLKSQGYKFHHYVEDTQTFVYGKRPQDEEDGKELMNASCKELIGGLVLSPDEKQVLLVWEGGKWMYATGYAITRESVVDALKREMRSQLNVELDKTTTPHFVGGWNRAAARFDCINESFQCFAMRSTTLELRLDEGVHARWFQIDELVKLLDMVDDQFEQLNTDPKLDAAIEHPPGNMFSHLALRWIKAFKTGRSWPVENVADRSVFCVF